MFHKCCERFRSACADSIFMQHCSQMYRPTAVTFDLFHSDGGSKKYSSWTKLWKNLSGVDFGVSTDFDRILFTFLGFYNNNIMHFLRKLNTLCLL